MGRNVCFTFLSLRYLDLKEQLDAVKRCCNSSSDGSSRSASKEHSAVVERNYAQIMHCILDIGDSLLKVSCLELSHKLFFFVGGGETVFIDGAEAAIGSDRLRLNLKVEDFGEYLSSYRIPVLTRQFVLQCAACPGYTHLHPCEPRLINCTNRTPSDYRCTNAACVNLILRLGQLFYSRKS